MNRIISWLQISFLRQVLTVFFVALALVATPAFNSYEFVANAETVTSPEGIYYKATPDERIHNRTNVNKDRSVFDASDATKNQGGEKAQNPLKNAIKNPFQHSNDSNTVTSPEGVYYKGIPDDSIHNRVNEQNSNQSVFDASDATKNQGGDTENFFKKAAKNSFDEGSVNTPEGAYYKAMPDDSIHNRINGQNSNRSVFDASEATKNQGAEKSENPIEKAIDTVREKLNLDEELPRSTKEFLKETEEKVEETVEPVTGTRKGYYQIP
jgi:hypothetical protein